ncbi:hypothetical protein GOV06_00355 [Candidatus Woesearchaeota archaeon]|nr:hypothetical protein [Candidatus Woesearchaeota archaeon]
MKIIEKLLVTGGLLAALAGCGVEEPKPYTPPPPIPPPTYTREETNLNKNMDEFVHLTSWWHDDYSQVWTDYRLEELHSLGVEGVTILVTEYQDNVDSTKIFPLGNKTPSEESLEHVIQKAKSLGMKVKLKPHVDVRTGDWRGDIGFSNESDWIDWFTSYEDFITYYADFAEANGVDELVIGTELSGTTHRSEWDGVADLVRSEFSGEISYAANWDNYDSITWWDKVDEVGVSFYFPLTPFNDPTPAELDAALAPIVQDLKDFSILHGKKIAIEEFGCQPYDGANTSPNWAPTTVVDEIEQADVYEAIFKALHNQGFVSQMTPWGRYCGYRYDDFDFDFMYRPAALVVDDWYHRDG